MSRAPQRVALASLGMLALWAGHARAEGSAQSGYNQRLDLTNYAITLKVNAQAGEVITIAARPVSSAAGMYPWPAAGPSVVVSAVITTPAGAVVTVPLTSGAGLLTVPRLEDLPRDAANQPVLPISGSNAPLKFPATVTGTYHVAFRKNAAVDLLPYDISVVPNASTAARPFSPPGGRGRLHSTRWGFDAGAYVQAAGTNAQFYVNAPGAVPGSSYIWQMDLQGLAGYVYDVVANDTGLDPPYARSSRSRWITPEPKNTPLYDIYLTPPPATDPAVRPQVAFTGTGGNGITMMGSGGRFRFRSNLSGSYQIVIDANRDGVFDGATGSADAILAGRAVPGANDAVWDGRIAGQVVVPAGAYAAKLFLRVGEFHFVAYDDENNYPGLSIRRIDADTLVGSPTLLYWDDRQVPVPDGSRRAGGGVPSRLNTLPGGVMSDVQRHAWGNTWVYNSFGNEAYVDTWVIGDEDTRAITVEVQSPQADLDGDGIANALDEYPCDATKSSSLFIPGASSFGMVMFEDLWPSNGDFDFNDTVIAYNYELIYGAQGQLTAIRANFNVLAVGASIHNGLGLHLPFPAARVARAYRRIGGGNADIPTIYDSNGELLIRVVNDLRTTFAVGDGFVNTRTTDAVRAPISITLLIELAEPVALSAAAAPFDLFLYHTHDPSHEIHRPMYAGTEAMNPSLFGTMSDGSSETRHFVNDRGVPFVLDVPQSTLYPLEQRPIDWLYPDILVFGTSGGASARTYYATNVQLPHAYSGDVFGATRALPAVPPRVEVYASGCRRVVE